MHFSNHLYIGNWGPTWKSKKVISSGCCWVFFWLKHKRSNWNGISGMWLSDAFCRHGGRHAVWNNATMSYHIHNKLRGIYLFTQYEIWRISLSQHRLIVHMTSHDRLEAGCCEGNDLIGACTMFVPTICLYLNRSPNEIQDHLDQKECVSFMKCPWYIHLWDPKEWPTKVNSS